MKIKASYNKITGKILGYYPDFIQYPNDVINEEAKTINGQPYIEITEEEHQEVSGKQMCVVDGILQECKKPTNEKRQDLKNELIAPCRLYLNQTFQAAFEALEDGLEFPEKEKRKLAKAEIRQIEAMNTIKELSDFKSRFKKEVE